MKRSRTIWTLCLALGWAGSPVAGDETLLPVPEPVDARPIDEPAALDPEASTGADNDADTEVIRTRYPNRKVKVERHVAQDEERNYVSHGTWTMWSPDGAMIGTGQYDWGKRVGKWARVFSGTSAASVAGPLYKEFSEPFVSEANFEDDELSGTWLILDAQKRKIRSWQFDHGVLHGKAVWWFPNGSQFREVTYLHGSPDGESREWAPDGRLVAKEVHLNGQRLAPYVKRYKDGGNQIEGWYLQAREVVNTTYDWWEGVVKNDVVKKEGTDAKHGKWVHRYPDGGKSFEGRFEHGRAVGRHTWWYANGQKRIEGQYVDGKESGTWTWWHLNGLKELEGNYANGVQDGTWIRWSTDGKVAEVQEHSLNSPSQGYAAEEIQPVPDAAADGTARVSDLPPIPQQAPPLRRLNMQR